MNKIELIYSDRSIQYTLEKQLATLYREMTASTAEEYEPKKNKYEKAVRIHTFHLIRHALKGNCFPLFFHLYSVSSQSSTTRDLAEKHTDPSSLAQANLETQAYINFLMEIVGHVFAYISPKFSTYYSVLIEQNHTVGPPDKEFYKSLIKRFIVYFFNIKEEFVPIIHRSLNSNYSPKGEAIGDINKLIDILAEKTLSGVESYIDLYRWQKDQKEQ